MIPLTVAEEIQETLLDYLTTTFNFQDQTVEQALLGLLKDPENGLFKGPYLHLRLPFLKVESDTSPPLKIGPNFTPYVHQQRAFQRLTSQNGHAPQPTLITTGTGSGKTECFLFPILDHCYAHRREPGLKAIILYPMNALAADQATRLAETIWHDSRLKGQITAGMYVGGEGQKHTVLGANHLITDRETLRKYPPDILLTNYRMLDFLLLRPDDKPLWANNQPHTLRYLVLDELHTYDGAQGSDVAGLIRRLTARLGTPAGVLCPVGTSATVGSNTPESLADLTQFAGQVFGVAFDTGTVIGEARINLTDFLPDPPIDDALPTDLDALREQTGEGYQTYIQRQMRLWFNNQDLSETDLADRLKQHSLLHTLLTGTQDQILPWAQLIDRLVKFDPTLANQPDPNLLVQSFLALIAHARSAEPISDPQASPAENGNEPDSFSSKVRIRPFLTVQVQLWVREISRLMRVVNAQAQFLWSTDLLEHSDQRGLPPYYCRECGHSGWLTVIHEGDSRLASDAAEIYRKYFDRHKTVRYVYPDPQRMSSSNPVEAETQASSLEREPGEGKSTTFQRTVPLTNYQLPIPTMQPSVCPDCLVIHYKDQCPVCHLRTVPVIIFHETSRADSRQPQDLQRCPMCGTDNALSIVGSQAASLSSVAISHLFTSPLNTDKKLLAFTDSVQDASHRAAFFGARTYRFGMRTAFQATLANNAAIPLIEFTDRVLDHWQQQWSNDQKVAATFMPPDLQGLATYREYVDSHPGPMRPGLAKDLRLRLSWEVTMEYGFNARLGRSLEKVGSSTALIDPDQLSEVVDKVALIVPEEIGGLGNVSRRNMGYFIEGLLDRLRLRGGIIHPLLRRYVREQGLWYMLTKNIQPLLSRFHKRSRLPKFLSDRPERGVFDVYLTSGKRPTWYVDWAWRTVSANLGTPEINDLYRLVIDQLTQAGILQQIAGGKANAYGLRPEALQITSQTAGLRCTTCGHQHTVTPATLEHWLGFPCLSFQCRGYYQEETRLNQHYYQAIYQRGQVERIFSREHTGLLSRKARDDTEAQFKAQEQADATNLLTATPTLEMGIDIGDLSATMACSVPPASANYLQRIGRAGRETGNSLILTLANTRPHDLYFFAEPLEMIAGAITPPGCYLDAPDMLKRQFLAFCMDNWVVNDPRVQILPRDVRGMLARYKKGGFPENLLAFFDDHQADLIERFLRLFGTTLSTETLTRLRAFARDDVLAGNVRRAVQAVELEREDLRKARRRLKQRRDRIEADPGQYQDPDGEIEKLDREMKLLVSLIKNLEDKYILNFFTDAGLLPNYAFPETGVRLDAIITGLETRDDNDKKYEVKDYLRPAAVAIKELAPFNRFYAEGHKLPINFVEVGRSDKAIECWQFCDRCAHMVIVPASHYQKTCPQCGSSLWSDKGQQHDMVRLRRVASRIDHYSSLVGDDAEEREREYYQMGQYLESYQKSSSTAHLVPGLPFGFEYLDQANLREINFGPQDALGRQVMIDAEARTEEGYKICQNCGLVVSVYQNFDDANAPQHSSRCQFRLDNQAPKWHNVYLYREMSSEALRLLLPVSTILVEDKLSTFAACLYLGLKRYLRGDPDHLQIMAHTEPTSDNSRRQYLVIYDTVPGGTSLLRDLSRPNEFFKMLDLALATLKSCECRHDLAKKACYRCLYSYRHQYALEQIDRQLGVDMLSEILARRNELESIPSLSEVHIDSLVESELEQRFVDALAGHVKADPNGRWLAKVHNGKRVWDLTLNSRRWRLEPQVLLDENENVAITSRPDFILWPLGSKDLALKSVAVFTDGFTYHVQPSQPVSRLGDDIQKRRAILDSGRFLVWSITWDDVKEFEEDKPPELSSLLSPQENQMLTTLLKSVPDNPLNSKLTRTNGVTQLIQYLQTPAQELWTRFGMALASSMLGAGRPPVSGTVLEALISKLQTSSAPPNLDIPADTPPGDTLYQISDQQGYQLIISVPKTGLQQRKIEKFSIAFRLDDPLERRREEGFVKSWRQFWLLTNLFQFLPGFIPLTTEYIRHFTPASRPSEAPPVEADISTDWQEALEFAASACESLLKAALTAGLTSPVAGYELLGDTGQILAEAELAWETQKVAVFLAGYEAESKLFEAKGWQVFQVNEAGSVIAAINE